MRRRGWLVAMAGVLAAVAGCAPSVTYRYRLTVEVETPDGMRSGSSVIETNIHDTTGNWWALGEARRASSRVRGEAVFVDLGSGRNVVALLARGPQADQGIDFNWLVPNTLHVDPLKDPASLLRRPGLARRCRPISSPRWSRSRKSPTRKARAWSTPAARCHVGRPAAARRAGNRPGRRLRGRVRARLSLPARHGGDRADRHLAATQRWPLGPTGHAYD